MNRLANWLFTVVPLFLATCAAAQSPSGNFDDVFVVGRPRITGTIPSFPAGQVFDNDRVDVFDDLPPQPFLVARLGRDTKFVNRSELNLFDGAVGPGLTFTGGSNANLFGGVVNGELSISDGGVVNASGGAIVGLSVSAGGSANLLDGATALGGLGTAIFQVFDQGVINVAGANLGSAAIGVNPGGELDISAGNVEIVESIADSSGRLAHIRMTGGAVEAFDVGRDSQVEISGGSVGGRRITDGLFVNGGAKVDVSGGSFTRVIVRDGGSLNLSGGAIPNANFSAAAGASIHLFGDDFMLDGQPIIGLTPGVSFVFPVRSGVLTTTLTDGSPFTYGLNRLPPDAVLTLNIAVPTPSSLFLLLLGGLVTPQRSRSLRSPLASLR